MSTSPSRIGFRHVPIGAALLAIFAAAAVWGQQPNARQNAPIDLTGYWVSVVTEDWRWRMITPPPGDYASMPMTPAAREVADRWDREADARDGNACRPYGAGGIMRLPTRLRILWLDSDTLQVETDAGTQTRLFHFAEFEPIAEPDWQGNSVAEWELTGGRGGVTGGNLKVVTTGFRTGYLRWNGVPYSEQAVVTEYFDRYGAFGQEWITVTTVVDDPLYFREPVIVTSDFRREADGSGWNPTPCVTDPPVIGTAN